MTKFFSFLVLTKNYQCVIMCKVNYFTPRSELMHEKNVEIGYLLDFYGSLLPERSQDILDMYYNSDMSLSEISDELGITRQGVRETVRRAGNALLTYEEKLGMASKFRIISNTVDLIEEEADRSNSNNSEIKRLAELIRSEITD